MFCRCFSSCLLVLLSATWPTVAEDAVSAPRPGAAKPTVFDLPRIQAMHARVQREVMLRFKAQDYAGIERLLADWLSQFSADGTSWYNLACAQARQGKQDAALTSLASAVDAGFRNAEHLEKDEDLASLRADKRFTDLAARARELAAGAPPGPLKPPVQPTPLADGVALVTVSNTFWNPQSGVFHVYFEIPGKPTLSGPVITGQGDAGALVSRWYLEGTARGNWGDLYENRDHHHSDFKLASFPQFSRIEFSPAAKERQLDKGLQTLLQYNTVVIGNSSTAMTEGLAWRSVPRLAMVEPAAMLRLYNQYVSNHLYFYPEHKDYDPGHNGKPDGFGDVYPANVPFFVVSQGSSFTDQPFMHAVACTLAAFRPETKDLLVQAGILMPTVQMILRRCSKAVGKPEDYLTGRAHPPVFRAEDLDPVAMVTLAHDMPKDKVPPMVQLSVQEEDQLRPGLDYVDNGGRQLLFETPGAVARIFRSTRYEHRLVVSAAASRDLNKLPLTYHWKVLCGDAERVRIRPLADDGSRAEIVIPWHDRFPIAPGASLETNRVDIGVFAHNGHYYSAPGMISCYFPDNERREYNIRKQLVVLDYCDPKKSVNYVDPLLEFQKTWRDEFHYTNDGRPIGWTRIRPGEKQDFTADGSLVLEKDAQGRPVKAQTVDYVIVPRENWVPYLEARPGTELRGYEYADAQDRVGRLSSRSLAPRPPPAEKP